MFSKGVFYLLRNQTGQARLQTLLRSDSGQALLIIVLVMVVALTVGLSVASRTITNLRNTRDQANSQKALSAAEAGIEQSIKSGVSIGLSTISNNTTYSTTVSQVDGTLPFLLNGGNVVPKNDAIYVWVSRYEDKFSDASRWSGDLTIYWGNNSGDCNNAAIEISVISGSKAAPVLTRYTSDPCGTPTLERRGTNNFGNASVSNTPISGRRLYYKKTIPITNGLLVRVDPIYSSAFIGVSGSIALPLQGNIITSTGTSDNTTQRKITVFQSYPEVPAEFFPYILFSP